MDKRRVVITGLGTVNPTGNTVAESWAAVKNGVCGVGPITHYDTADSKTKLAAEVKDFDPAVRVDKRESRKMARFTQFAVAAAIEAMEDAGIDMEKTQHNKPLSELPAVDVVVTMGCGVNCPFLPCSHREDWGLNDPTDQGDEVFLDVMARIEEKVRDLKDRILAGELK